jgi:tetratricopeptide (TPR) repeat protein
MGKYDDAAKTFDRSLKLVEDSNLSPEIKNNSTLLHHFNMTAVAIAKKDMTGAKSHAVEFGKGAEATKNPAQLKQSHELAGRIALAEKDYAKAVTELQQANLQNAQNLYRLSQAYKGQGDSAKAAEYLKKTVEFNPLPALPFAFIRVKAQKEAGTKG